MSVTREDSSGELPVTIYSATSRLSAWSTLVKGATSSVRQSRELAWRLFVRDLSAQYRQSVFGIVWAFVPPIMMAVVFVLLRSRGIIAFEEADVPYPVYALSGTVLWQLFVQSLNAPLKAVQNARAIIAKISIPYEALILSTLLSLLFQMLTSLVVLATACIVFDVSLGYGFLVAPVAILALILLGMALGLLVTPIGMLFTDVTTGLPVVTQLWFFVTPVVYRLPDEYPYSLIGLVNPVTPLLTTARDLLTTGVFLHPGRFATVSLSVLVVLVVAWVLYRLAMPIIIERIGA